MPRELDAGLGHDGAVTRVDAASLQERAVVVARQEAGLLALAAPGDGEPGALCLGPRLGLRLLAEREDDALELGRIEPGEHVRLVLAGIGGTCEQLPPAVLDDPGVVPCCKGFGAGAARESEQAAEAERAVAAHARVRRLTARVPAHERIDHGTAKVLTQVQGYVRNAERMARLPRGDHGLGRAARTLGVGPVGIEPQPKR